MRMFFLLSWVLAVSVPLLPLAYFLAIGWKAREAEFIDKVRDQTQMDIYFKKFWSEGWTRYQTRYRARHRPSEPGSPRLISGALPKTHEPILLHRA
jgi:hypothetical protein